MTLPAHTSLVKRCHAPHSTPEISPVARTPLRRSSRETTNPVQPSSSPKPTRGAGAVPTRRTAALSVRVRIAGRYAGEASDIASEAAAEGDRGRVSSAAYPLRQASGGRSYDRTGGRVGEQLERECRAIHHLALAPAVARAAQPTPPERHRGLEFGGDIGIRIR